MERPYSANLKELIKEQGIHKYELAEKIKTTPQTISKACNNVRLTFETAENIIKAYPQYNIGWLLGYSKLKYKADVDAAVAALESGERYMENEYGTPLDRNGYAPSIMQRDQFCYWCGKSEALQRHEVYGSAYRDKSKSLGLWVYLCPECHHRLHFIHADMKLLLRQRGQVTAQAHYGWSDQDFRDHFGKVYR